MSNQSTDEVYANHAQRVVSSYKKLLAPCQYVDTKGALPLREQEQRDLHAFFQALYASLYAQPELFGLPALPDDSIADDEPNKKAKKQAVKRLLDKPRGMLTAGLDYLMQAGVQGSLEGGALHLENYYGMLKQVKVGKNFLAGLGQVGLVITPIEDRAVLSSTRFAALMPALQALSARCAAYQPKELGKFFFATCDFRALGGYMPQAPDLYRTFAGADYHRVMVLHEYFASKGYKTEIAIHAPNAWVVKYQGDRKVKSTPLFQVEYDDRYGHPLQMQIKCVSAARLAAVLPRQPRLLQDDFARRVNPCRGDDCGWCRNQKTLGPAVLEINGVPRTVCWYTNPDVRKFDDHTVELIQQYEQMHAALAPENCSAAG